MKLLKMAGLEPGYQRCDRRTLLNRYSVARKTWEEGVEMTSYSTAVTRVWKNGLIRYHMKTEGEFYCRFNFQVETESVWDTVCGPLIPNKEWDCFRERNILVRTDPEECGASVFVMDSEFLPSSDEGDPVRMQVTGYPVSMKVVDSVPGEGYMMRYPTEEGLTDFRYLQDGEIWSIGVSYHLVFQSDTQRKIRESLRRRPAMMDNVLYARINRIEYPGLPGNTPVAYVDTQFGELGIIMSNLENWEKADELEVGKYLFAVLQIRGIAGIGDKERGIRLNLENNLRAMKSIQMGFSATNAYLLLPLLADDVTYYSQFNDTEYRGIREVLMKIKYNMELNSMLHTPTELAVVLNADEEAAYPCEPGTLCLSVADHTEVVFSLMFFELDEANRIRKILAVDSNGYEIRPKTFWDQWENEIRDHLRLDLGEEETNGATS